MRTVARIAGISSTLLLALAAAPPALAAPKAKASKPPGGGGGAAVVLEVSDATTYEGDAGTTLLSFQVRLIGSFTGKTQTVSYQTADGDATAGSDYTAVTGTLTFDKKTPVRTVVVPVLGDTDQEPDEHFLLLVGPTGGGDPEGRGRILNDDGWPDS